MPTLCSTCDHVHPDTRKRHPGSWVCMKFPRLVGKGFVDDETWIDHEPFMRCSGINGGACPMWERSRDEQMENGI